MEYKVIILGDSGVGKTSLLNRYLQKSQTNKKDTSSSFGIELVTKTIQEQNQTIILKIWDTAGLEEYRTITPQHYRKTVGAIIVYDITNRNSFQNLSFWVDEVRYFSEPELEIILVGNKIDQQNKRKIDKIKGQGFAESLNAEFIETSALEDLDSNIDEINVIETRREKYYFK